MRRKTPGVVKGSELLPALIKRVERHDAARVVELLEPLVLDRRAQRLKDVIGQRLESVQVVFDAPHDPHNGAAVLRSCEAFGVQYVHVIERLEKAEVPVGPVYDLAQVFADPHVRERGMEIKVDHPFEHALSLIRNPLTFSETPVTDYRAPPLLGEHTKEVLTKLGYDDARLEALQKQRII